MILQARKPTCEASKQGDGTDDALVVDVHTKLAGIKHKRSRAGQGCDLQARSEITGLALFYCFQAHGIALIQQ